MIILIWSKKCWKYKKIPQGRILTRKQLNGSQIYMPTSVSYQFITSHLKTQFNCLFCKNETEFFKDFPFPIWHDVKLFQKRMLEQRCRTIFSGTSVFSLMGFFSWRLRLCPAPALHWAFPAIWLTNPGLLKWAGVLDTDY